MKTVRWLPFLLLVVPLVLAGCGGSDGSKEKNYDIKGIVTALDVAEKKVTLDHEAIPGFMKAMEMPFDVTDAKVLEGLKVGDQVQGRLRVKAGEQVITELKKR